MKVSVILPCYNSEAIVTNCLKSFFRTDFRNYELIIIDDHSLDGTYEIVKKLSSSKKNIKLFRNNVNLGPSATRNFGIKKSMGKYIAFIETDMEFEPAWLKHLVKKLDEDKDVAAVQSKVMELHKRNLIQAVGVRYDPHTFWVVSVGMGLPKDSIKIPEKVGLGSVGTLYRKSVLKKVGGFDEKLVHNIDDIDLSWRIWLAGYTTLSEPSSITYHWAAKPSLVRSLSTPAVRSEFYSQKTLRVFLKNYEAKSLVKYVPWLYFAMMLRIVKNIIHGNLKPLIGFLKSIFWNLSVLADTLHERKRIQSLRKRSDNEIIEIIGLKGSFFQIFLGQIRPTMLKAMEAFTQ